MEAFLKTLQGLGAVRITVIASVAAALIGFMIFALTQLATPNMSLLYGNLELSEGAQIATRLDEMAVPFSVKGDGSQIYVPADQVSRLRMTLAEAGLPSGGSIGYEIFDKSDILGTTSFVQDINLLRALEGELARTIRSIQNVGAARVHIVLPKRELFSKEKEQPTASILLKMKGRIRLNTSQIQGIQHLVAAAVPGLSPDQISILDDRGTLLAKGEGKNGEIPSLPFKVEEARVAYESRISRMIEALLSKSVGENKVRAEVSIDIDLDRLTEQSEDYNPDGQVVRSSQNSSDIESTQDGNQPTTAQNNLPNMAGGASGGGPKKSGKKSEETLNYEISKKTTTRVKEWGGIKRLSVVVLVDGFYQENAEGKSIYTPRSKEEMNELTKLVQTAVGFQKNRGDTVEVVNMRFIEDTPESFLNSTTIMGFERPDLLRVVENLLLAAIGFLVLLFVVRPLINRLFDLKSNPHLALEQISPSTPTSLSEGAQETSTDLSSEKPASSMSEQEQEAQEQLIGHMRASLIQHVEKLIEDYPENSASILRAWMKNS